MSFRPLMALLDADLSRRLTAIARKEQMSVIALCRLVEDRLTERERRGHRVCDRNAEMIAALHRLVESYEMRVDE